MRSIFLKEIRSYFSSIVGYVAILVFLVFCGLFLWVFEDSGILSYGYASLDRFFELAPWLLILLIPAITMRSFADEFRAGTIEWLSTKPLKDSDIILGKYFASLLLVAFALLPTVLYYYTVYQLGSPKGNLDSGAILGSYIGLFLLAGSFAAVGLFASSLSVNQIVAFILATFLCFLLHWGFDFFSRLPVFAGRGEAVVQMFGIDYHYASISRGVIDTRDVAYFLSLISFFIMMTVVSLERRKW